MFPSRLVGKHEVLCTQGPPECPAPPTTLRAQSRPQLLTRTVSLVVTQCCAMREPCPIRRSSLALSRPSDSFQWHRPHPAHFPWGSRDLDLRAMASGSFSGWERQGASVPRRLAARLAVGTAVSRLPEVPVLRKRSLALRKNVTTIGASVGETRGFEPEVLR